MQLFTTTLGPSLGRRVRLIALATVLAVGFAACGDDDDDDAASNEPETTEETTGGDTGGDAGQTAPYDITDISYHDATAPAGSTLEIVNSSGVPHTFTADDGAFDVEFGGGETATVDLPAEPGDYPFHCEIHSSMQATLTVE